MKTYILSIIKDIQKYSENLDAKAILCNKPWIVFNDAGEKEVYIFKKEGKLRIVLSGRVFDTSWEYESSNKSIIINGVDERYMVHPAFVDGTVLALNVDGTDKYSFLIEEENVKKFAPKTLTELNDYFLELKQSKLEEERRLIKAKEIATKKKAQKEIRLKKERIEYERRLSKFLKFIGISFVSALICYFCYKKIVYVYDVNNHGKNYAILHSDYSSVDSLGNGFYIVSDGKESYVACNSEILEDSRFYDREQLKNGDILLKNGDFRGIVNPISRLFLPLIYDSIIPLYDHKLYNVRNVWVKNWAYVDFQGNYKTAHHLAHANLLEKDLNVIEKIREENGNSFYDTLLLVNQNGDVVKRIGASLVDELKNSWEGYYVIASTHAGISYSDSAYESYNNRCVIGLYNKNLDEILPKKYSKITIKGSRICCSRNDSVWYLDNKTNHVFFDGNKTSENIKKREKAERFIKEALERARKYNANAHAVSRRDSYLFPNGRNMTRFQNR